MLLVNKAQILRQMTWLALSLVISLYSAGQANAISLDDSVLKELEGPESRYKISPEMVDRLREMLKPIDLDSEVADGFVLDSISVERFWVRFGLLGGSDTTFVYVLPPVVQLQGTTSSESFRFLVEGSDAGLNAAAAVVSRLTDADDGRFWPAAKVQAKTAPRRMHFTHVLGDILVVITLILMVFTAKGFVAAFADRRFLFWLAGAGVLAYSFAVRLLLQDDLQEPGTVILGFLENIQPTVPAWLFNSFSRFAAPTTGLLASITLVLSAITPFVVFLAISLIVEGVWAPLVAAIFVASFPALVSLSFGSTALVFALAFFAFAFLCFNVYIKTRLRLIHTFAIFWTAMLLFTRPEGLLLALPLLALPFLHVPRNEWRLEHFWAPMSLAATAAILRIATLSSGPDWPGEFLTIETQASALLSNVGRWLLHYERVPASALLLWSVALVSRPWRKNTRTAIVALAMLLIPWLVYYHVDLVDYSPGSGPNAGGRASLMFVIPLSLLAAWGTAGLTTSRFRYKWFILAGCIIFCLLSPFIYNYAIHYEYPIAFRALFWTGI